MTNWSFVGHFQLGRISPKYRMTLLINGECINYALMTLANAIFTTRSPQCLVGASRLYFTEIALGLLTTRATLRYGTTVTRA